MRRRNRLLLEALERRDLCAAGLCNPFNELDVDDDGFVVARDALIVINHLNRLGAGSAAAAEPQSAYPDVSGDGFVSPLDALLVINQLNAGPPPLALALARSDDPDGNGVVLAEQVTIQGQTTPGSKVRLRSAAGDVQLAAADGSGRFALSVELSHGANEIRVDVADPSHRGASQRAEVRLGDVVLDWNAALLNVVRDWATFSNDPYPNRIVPSQPPRAARNLAMVHAAMFDAVNAIAGTFEPYQVDVPAPPGASPVAAAAAAAHKVASDLYREPDERAIFDAALLEALATVPDGPAEALGIALGESVGAAILAWRASDGASASASYTPGSQPGDWNRTFPDFYPPLLPQWPGVAPFAMSSGAQFRPPPPPALDSAEYAAAVDEVLRLGASSSSERTPEQTEIALFWSDGGGTFTPPGHWNQIAADVAVGRELPLVESARVFALLNIALADAGIVSWDAKYAYDLWRPIDAIRKAADDGNAATYLLADWNPLLRTPPFPTYTSGHSTFSGAADAVLTGVFGATAFTSQADAHQGFTQRPLAAEDVATRSFTSFTQAADEAGKSRIYGGIHFEFDNAAGLSSGRQVGAYVVTNFLKRRQ
jgi:hypothetical protein